MFQTESEIVCNVYNESENIKVFNDLSVSGSLCAVYFSSHNIYFPNIESVFKKKIIQGDYYEWENLRLPNASRHIFVRDVKKQWYVEGVNHRLNSIDLLAEEIKILTAGYEVVCIGSSAGGYAAVLIGNIINAVRVYSFNGQTNLNTLLEFRSNPSIDPLIFKYKNLSKYTEYYDISKFLNQKTEIFYFVSINSDWDKEQYELINSKQVNCLLFNSSRHGIPFLKSCFPEIFLVKPSYLKKLSQEKNNPMFFSFLISGAYKTIFNSRGIFGEMVKLLKKWISKGAK